MKWLAQLCPHTMDLEDKIETLTNDLTRADGYLHESAEREWRARGELVEMRASLVATASAADQFKRMWEEVSERAVTAEREANFYRTAYSNVHRAVNDAETDRAGGVR